jgi:hypothetical protein
MWFLKILKDAPTAVWLYRKQYKIAKKIEKERKKFGIQAGYELLLETFPAAALDPETYFDTWEEIRDNCEDEEQMQFLELGVELGFVRKQEQEEQPETPDWKSWEDGEE